MGGQSRATATTTAANPDETLFTARLNNVRPLVNMLRTIGFRPRALCTISDSGMVFTVNEAQAMVAQAYLRSTLFTVFHYNNEIAKQGVVHVQQNDEGGEEGIEHSTQITLPLDSLIECLTLFYGPSSSSSSLSQGISTSTLQGPVHDLRGATTAHVAYNGQGSDFELMLEERGTISVCRLATFEPEPAVDLDFSRYPIVQQLIIRSEWLRDAFNELDPTSDAVSISISASEPYFRIATVGDNGSTELTYARDERIVDSYFCNEEMENRYRLQLILKCRSALAMSDKTKIRVNQRGFICFQFMVPTDANVSFAIFVFAPLVHADEPM
ncbi:checkpoint clamp complex protein Rad1 [Coemansia sp. Benny D115]|nr:checkpoint clamp complex protein Rad1 [Coemansia sp. Benny D115]